VRILNQEDRKMLEVLAILTLLVVGAIVFGVFALLAGIALVVVGPVVLVLGLVLLIPLLILGGIVWAGIAVVT
jgi:hypothetical protein